MKIAYQIAKAANKLLMALSIAFALILCFYSLYVLYDVLYTEKTAFASYDLLQYKPAAGAAEEDPNGGFENLQKLNSDSVGWITIYGTNIDYPIVQGEDDLEYSAKDIYGKSSLTGAIYLSCENDSNFTDWYNLVYGHHMDNGAMFGDIGRYRDEGFFRSHRKGLLQTPDETYEMNIFACTVTDSYAGEVYSVAGKEIGNYSDLLEFIRNHSVSYDAGAQKGAAEDSTKIVALSTCEDAMTNGRIVLFAELIPGGKPAPEIQEEKKVTLLEAVGHISDQSHWAFLNLICVILSFGILLPLVSIRRKYRQYGYARRKAKEYDEILDGYEQTKQQAAEEHTEEAPADSGETPPCSEAEAERFEKIRKGLRRFLRSMRIGVLLELLLFIIAVIVFLRTENITKPMVIRDKWTGLMILLTTLSLIADFICFRYRGERPEHADDQQNHEDAVPASAA